MLRVAICRPMNRGVLMGLFKTLLGKKTFCSVCGAPVSGVPLTDNAGKPLCSDACASALERLSNAPPAKSEAESSADGLGGPELIVYVFRTNDPSAYYALQERIIEMCGEPQLKVERLDGADVSLVAVSGPVGSIEIYRRHLRAQFGALAGQSKNRLEDMRPDVTYTNVSEAGKLRRDPAIDAVRDKVRKGVFRPVFSGPPSVPPTSSAPVLRAMNDELLLQQALALVDRHVSFLPGGVVKVESDGLREAALIFGELARRRPSDPDPAYLEASAYMMGMRRDLAQARLESLRERFPDHLETCMLVATGKSVFAYPSYEPGQPIPDSLRDRMRGATVVMMRQGSVARPVMLVEIEGSIPRDRHPLAYPSYVESEGVPILGVTVVFADEPKVSFESVVAGFEEHDGRWCLSPRACHLFRTRRLPVVGSVSRAKEAGSEETGMQVGLESADRRSHPVLAVEAEVHESSRELFMRCEASFRALHPRAFGPQELSAALDVFHRRDESRSMYQ